MLTTQHLFSGNLKDIANQWFLGVDHTSLRAGPASLPQRAADAAGVWGVPMVLGALSRCFHVIRFESASRDFGVTI